MSSYDQKVQEAMNAHHSNIVPWRAGNNFALFFGQVAFFYDVLRQQ